MACIYITFSRHVELTVQINLFGHSLLFLINRVSLISTTVLLPPSTSYAIVIWAQSKVDRLYFGIIMALT